MMINTDFKADAFILGYKRNNNIPQVLKGLRRQSFVRNIYVFHNARMLFILYGVASCYKKKGALRKAKKLFWPYLRQIYVFPMNFAGMLFFIWEKYIIERGMLLVHMIVTEQL